LCISSTGIKFNHQEFQGRARYDSFDPIDEVTGSNQQGRDCHGHGTHVAGLVAGKTFGVAKRARVFSTRVLECNGDGLHSTVIRGINHVIRAKQRNRSRRIIINISISGDPSPATLSAIRTATNEGILVVVAAGNNFEDACRYYLLLFLSSISSFNVPLFFYTSTPTKLLYVVNVSTKRTELMCFTTLTNITH